MDVRGSLAALFGLTIQFGCSTVPPPVVAPVGQAGLRGAMTWSVDWGYARARIQRPDGSIQAISGNGDSSFGSPDQGLRVLSVPMPALASLHQMSGTWDTGEYAGWRRFGMTARFRLRTAANGALTSIAWSFNAHWSLRGLDAGVALEQTLPVATFMSVIGRVGMSYGLRDDDVQVPSDLDGSGFRDNTIAPPAHLDILRPDLRLEPLIGVVIGSHTFGVLSFQPYFTLAHGSITAVSCNDCVPGVRLVGFAQNFGFAVALTVHGP